MTEEVELQPEDESVNTEETEVDAVAGEGNEDAQNEDSSTEEDTPKKPWFTKRIDELTANWREEQRRSQQLMDQMARMQKPSEPEPQPVAGEPNLDQFETYDQYVAAVADYKAEQKFQQWEERQQAQTVQQQREQQRTQFEERAASFKAEHPDFDVVAMNPSLPITEAMAEALNVSDNGPQLLYQLGQNPAEAARIASLSPIQAGIEIGRMEAGISAPPPPKTQTRAPAPVEPLQGGSGSRTVDPNKMSADEWRIWREQQIGK